MEIQGNYRTVHKEGAGEIQEKKSRFLSFIFAVESEEEIQEILERFRKQYWDARHVCFAYVLHDNPPRMRFSDDGEPQGTAGKPMLELLTREGLENVLLIVVRYFGGVLLGTGGLLRAYTDSSREALDNAIYIEKKAAYLTEVSLDYGLSGRMPYIMADMELSQVDISYSDVVTYTIPIPVEMFPRFAKQMTELTKGGMNLEPGPLCYYGIADGECIIY